jgi:hypothetical protein
VGVVHFIVFAPTMKFKQFAQIVLFMCVLLSHVIFEVCLQSGAKQHLGKLLFINEGVVMI